MRLLLFCGALLLALLAAPPGTDAQILVGGLFSSSTHTTTRAPATGTHTPSSTARPSGEPLPFTWPTLPSTTGRATTSRPASTERQTTTRPAGFTRPSTTTRPTESTHPATTRVTPPPGGFWATGLPGWLTGLLASTTAGPAAEAPSDRPLLGSPPTRRPTTERPTRPPRPTGFVPLRNLTLSDASAVAAEVTHLAGAAVSSHELTRALNFTRLHDHAVEIASFGPRRGGANSSANGGEAGHASGENGGDGEDDSNSTVTFSAHADGFPRVLIQVAGNASDAAAAASTADVFRLHFTRLFRFVPTDLAAGYTGEPQLGTVNLASLTYLPLTCSAADAVSGVVACLIASADGVFQLKLQLGSAPFVKNGVTVLPTETKIQIVLNFPTQSNAEVVALVGKTRARRVHNQTLGGSAPGGDGASQLAFGAAAYYSWETFFTDDAVDPAAPLPVIARTLPDTNANASADGDHADLRPDELQMRTVYTFAAPGLASVNWDPVFGEGSPAAVTTAAGSGSGTTGTTGSNGGSSGSVVGIAVGVAVGALLVVVVVVAIVANRKRRGGSNRILDAPATGMYRNDAYESRL